MRDSIPDGNELESYDQFTTPMELKPTPFTNQEHRTHSSIHVTTSESFQLLRRGLKRLLGYKSDSHSTVAEQPRPTLSARGLALED